ncbi:Papain cysteine protease family protein [Acanthocheilonema viteae]
MVVTYRSFTGPLPEPDRHVFRYHGLGWIHILSDGSSYPPRWDWREKGGVTAVKNQSYKCNSCYACAVTAVIESLYAIKYQRYISISEYEMLDCDYTNNGCQNGSITRSLVRGKYILAICDRRIIQYIAFPKQYKFYKSGVLPGTNECSRMEPNHAAEVIGYGTENGKGWGNQGFFKIERRANARQVENYAVSAGL